MIIAAPSHAEIVAAIHRTAMPETAWTADIWRRLLAAPDAHARIVMDEDTPVGFLHMRRAGGEAEVVMIATHPLAQRRGIATALLNDACAALDGDPLFLEVAADNHAARALYARFGFEAVGHRHGYYRTPSGRQDALILRLATGASATGRHELLGGQC
ncbi:MAG: GNAT family N-acetyltransferase [Alphaproteobacteria bacterium]|nr:GNAT family N-acetyltransferase [Alphaproteobacteria bacterium]